MNFPVSRAKVGLRVAKAHVIGQDYRYSTNKVDRFQPLWLFFGGVTVARTRKHVRAFGGVKNLTVGAMVLPEMVDAMERALEEVKDTSKQFGEADAWRSEKKGPLLAYWLTSILLMPPSEKTELARRGKRVCDWLRAQEDEIDLRGQTQDDFDKLMSGRSRPRKPIGKDDTIRLVRRIPKKKQSGQDGA